jgi:uncharacterized membrane protein
MRVALLILGLLGILIGTALMIQGSRMCRGACLFEEFFQLVLPSELASLSGGLPWLIIGLAVTILAAWTWVKAK